MKAIMIVVLVHFGLHAQEITINKNQSSIVYINTIDKNELVQRNPSKSKKQLFLNQIAIDSTKLSFEKFIFLKGARKIYSHNTSEDRKIINFYSIEGTLIKREAELKSPYYVLPQQYLLSKNILLQRDKKFFSLNPITWEVSEFLDIKPYSNDLEPREVLFSANGNRILIEYGEFVGGGSDIYGFLSYDMTTGEIIDLTEKFRKFLPISRVTNLTFGIIAARRDLNHIYVKVIDDHPDSINDELVLDNNFKLVGKILPKSSDLRGVNIENEKIVSYNYSSTTDKENVIIKIKSSFVIEKAFYKIYNDSLLSLSEINLDESNLNLLKNFVFAKHNFSFDSEFYQSYFNMYKFYNQSEKRSSRNKDVNQLLTSTDKKNLALINSLLKKRSK
ncbi:MAG: YARHG domain-containing protein [Cyclobacteriaceae bacterium]|nr:YARHG domain-containing protein [Cyclobacteriaceae bacterium]